MPGMATSSRPVRKSSDMFPMIGRQGGAFKPRPALARATWRGRTPGLCPVRPNQEFKAMTIKVGDKIPSATLTTFGPEGPKPVSTDELFKGRTVGLFAVPGAFTPTCSARHLPSFKQHAAELKSKGVDVIACVSVNDVFVMKAWGEAQGV